MLSYYHTIRLFSTSFFVSLQILPVASLFLLSDSSEANRDNAESLIVTGGDPLISLLSALAPVMSAIAWDQAQAGWQEISQTLGWDAGRLANNQADN